MSTPLADPKRAQTLRDLACSYVHVFAEAVGMSERTQELERSCARLLTPWAALPLARGADPRPLERAPLELSFALGGSAELGFSVEPRGEGGVLGSDAAIGRALLRTLASDSNLDLSSFESLSDLFFPPVSRGTFALRLSLRMAGGEPPALGVELDPRANGPSGAPAVVEEALARLQFDRAWPVLGNVLARRGPELDELVGFSLQLSGLGGLSVTITVRHHLATPELVAAATAGCPSARPGEVQRFLRTAAPSAGTYDARPPVTCHTFVSGDADRPSWATTRFPIDAYSTSSEQTKDRVLACHEALRLPTAPYLRVLARAEAPAPEISYRRHPGGVRLAAHFPFDMNRADASAERGVPRKQSGFTRRTSPFAAHDSARHPLLSRLGRESPSGAHLALVVESLRPAWKPTPVDGAPESRAINALLVAHEHWWSAAASALARFCAPESELGAARRFERRLASLHASEPAGVRLGATLATSVCANELAPVVARELRRLGVMLPVDLPTAPDALRSPSSIVSRAGEDAREAMLAGATRWYGLLWTLCNDVYDACYGERRP